MWHLLHSTAVFPSESQIIDLTCFCCFHRIFCIFNGKCRSQKIVCTIYSGRDDRLKGKIPLELFYFQLTIGIGIHFQHFCCCCSFSCRFVRWEKWDFNVRSLGKEQTLMVILNKFSSVIDWCLFICCTRSSL